MPRLQLPPIFCKTCGYCLYALTTPRCPECGRAFDPADPRTFLPRPPRHFWRWLIRAAAVLLLFASVPASCWLYLYSGWRREQPIIADLRAKGCLISSMRIGPAWLQHLVPDKLAFVLDRTHEADLDGSLCDADLADVGKLEHWKIVHGATFESAARNYCGNTTRKWDGTDISPYEPYGDLQYLFDVHRARFIGLSQAQLAALLGPDDRMWCTPPNLDDWMAELGRRPNGTEKQIVYGPQGDETENLFFLLQDGRVVDVKGLFP